MVSCPHETTFSGNFGFDEESPQVRQLQRACNTKNSDLDQGPSYDARICQFGLVSEFGLTFLQL